MILFYGKWRVSDGVKALAESLHIPVDIRDDADLEVDFSKYNAIIPTPGVSPNNRIYKSDKILSEMDFAARYLPKGFKIICITGTDGKSTTAWIVYKLLCSEYGENKVFLSGNFEIPFSQTVRQIREKGLKHGYIVIEVSSFMAYNLSRPSGLKSLESLPKGERIGGFRSNHSIFTNFETDHLNWHPNLQDYFNAKMRVFHYTTGTSVINEQVFSRAREFGLNIPKDIPNVRVFGVNMGDIVIASEAKQSRLNKSFEKEEDSETSSGWRLSNRTDGENIIISGRKKYRLSETQFSGIHNAMNILSSTLVTASLKICSKRVKDYLKNISGLAHRLEMVTTRNGVIFVDDSKSTSAQSLIAALGSFEDKKICLIAGGSDKWDAFEHLGSILSKKVKHAELIGATREILGKICEQYGVSYHYSENMDEAVWLSTKIAESGDIILLSPGCASFGMFKDYLDRAQKFREAVNDLTL